MNDYHFEVAASAFHRGVGALTSVVGNALLSHFEFSGDSIIANRLSPRRARTGGNTGQFVYAVRMRLKP